jgi:phosphatidate cytidylyltransferase
MTKTVQRLLIFFVGLPAVVSLIVFFPHYNHLAANIAVTVVSALGAVEFAVMLRKKEFSVNIPEAALLGALSPLSMTLSVSFGISDQITPAGFIIGASWLLMSGIVTHKDGDFSKVASRLAAGFSVMMYPGHFLSWIIRMCLFEHSNIVLMVFILTVMANDSLAWTAGMLFGKGNRGFLKVSPGKSAAGFAAGVLASVLVCTGAAWLIPGSFKPDQIHWFPSGIFLGLFSGAAVVLGDLSESAIKRCCEFKDSGSLIPGRGGMLDSLDSVCFTAPVFYVLYRFFF